MWEKNRLWVLQPKGAGCGGKLAARGNLLRGAPSDPVSLRVFNLKEWFVYIDEETQRLALMIKP